MRLLTDHWVEGDSVNHTLKVEAVDGPGVGGANYRYVISSFATDEGMYRAMETLIFQNGPIKEVGVNGITHEVLLAVIIDRLRSFQAGPFSCRENAIAMTHCEEALMWLQRRTRARIVRGVEGTHSI